MTSDYATVTAPNSARSRNSGRLSFWQVAALALAVLGTAWAIGVGLHAIVQWPGTVKALQAEYAMGEKDCQSRYPEPDRQSRCAYLYSVVYHRDYNKAIMTPVLLGLTPPALLALVLWVAWFTQKRKHANRR